MLGSTHFSPAPTFLVPAQFDNSEQPPTLSVFPIRLVKLVSIYRHKHMTNVVQSHIFPMGIISVLKVAGSNDGFFE